MRFYWVQSPVGRIATAAAPNADRMLEEIIDMREEKVEFVLSLLQVDEATEIGLIDEELSLEAAGIGFRQIAIADFGIPENSLEIDSVIADMAKYLETGGSSCPLSRRHWPFIDSCVSNLDPPWSQE